MLKDKGPIDPDEVSISIYLEEMKMLDILLIATLLAFVLRLHGPGTLKVQDGDSLFIERNGRKTRYRVWGMDAPEWNQPHGGQASKALRAKLEGAWVLAIRLHSDAYGRRLVILWTRRGPIGLRMVAGGHAHGQGVIGLIVQIVARMRGVGLWARHGAMHPETWRGTRG